MTELLAMLTCWFLFGVLALAWSGIDPAEVDHASCI